MKIFGKTITKEKRWVEYNEYDKLAKDYEEVQVMVTF